MGDRANIVVPDPYNEGQAVYLYTHWAGSELPATLASALERGAGRWDDAPYLTRIIFNEMTKGEEMGETGYGISTGICDNGHALLVVDTKAQVVRAVSEKADLFDASAPFVAFAEATASALESARKAVGR